MHGLNIKLLLSYSCKTHYLTCTQISNTADTDYVHNQNMLRARVARGGGSASNLSTSCSVKGKCWCRIGTSETHNQQQERGDVAGKQESNYGKQGHR